jgi:hypothetical protein
MIVFPKMDSDQLLLKFWRIVLLSKNRSLQFYDLSFPTLAGLIDLQSNPRDLFYRVESLIKVKFTL